MRLRSLTVCLLLLVGTAAAAPALDGPPEAAETRAHALLSQDPPDWTGARQAFRRAAEAGSATAMTHLGWIHEEGHGVPRDGERAAHWYSRAAMAGADAFALKVAWMYLAGDGVDRDRERAEHWFGHAIDAQHTPAKTAWASVLISDALGGRAPHRVFEAKALLEDALDEGQIMAAYFLTRLYMEGIGDHPVDDQKAARYARIGADHGHGQMQGWLAFMYQQGQGVDADPVLAAKWANLAAAEGDPLGERLRRRLDESLDDEDRAAARRLAVEWALSRP